MGLGYPSLSTFPASPFFSTLVNQKKVAKGQFSFYLADLDSELFLGGSNPEKYQGDLDWNPVTKQVRSSIQFSRGVPALILITSHLTWVIVFLSGVLATRP